MPGPDAKRGDGRAFPDKYRALLDKYRRFGAESSMHRASVGAAPNVAMGGGDTVGMSAGVRTVSFSFSGVAADPATQPR